ncbi:hypothetical protein [Blastopirellula marina]|uniref:hypothetical protein n=1 Tax=Blastopirellula marina TaxID=124 RepID=UPI0011B02C33|nr:hypothetical protein [Blastopirellula marina]
MPLRTLVVLLSLACCLPGCRTWSWGRKAAPPVQEEPLVDNFTHTQPQPERKDDKEPTSEFTKTNGRADDPGTGLSDRSREIERSLGYR